MQANNPCTAEFMEDLMKLSHSQVKLSDCHEDSCPTEASIVEGSPTSSPQLPDAQSPQPMALHSNDRNHPVEVAHFSEDDYDSSHLFPLFPSQADPSNQLVNMAGHPIDIMGHPIIFQFKPQLVSSSSSLVDPQNDDDESNIDPDPDKENSSVRSSQYINNTPLKMRSGLPRSPLQDITPNMTHKKKRVKETLTVISDKSRLMTPNSMNKTTNTPIVTRFRRL